MANSSHVTFQQTIDNLPVSGAYVTFHLGPTARSRSCTIASYRSFGLTRPVSVTAVEAVQQARLAINFAAPRASSAAPEQIVLPD